MKKSKFVLLIIILIALICIYTKVYAGITISQSSVSMNVGESNTITLSASNATGTVSVSSSNPAVAIANADNWIEDGKSISITITGKSAGSATITVSGIVSDNSGKDDNYSKPISVTVKEKEQTPTIPTTPTTPATPTVTEKSNIATLSNLGIRPNDFSGFKSNTYSYNVEVSNETEKIEVYASPAKGQENKQKISGIGTKTLKEGVNTFEVIVTAEDGKTKKTYTINVTRKEKVEQPQEEPEKQPEETPEEPMEEIFGLSELKIEGLELVPQFQTDVYEYKIELKEDVEKLNITTLATEANSNIEIVGNENLKEGENIITIIVKGENEEKTATYQIIVNKIIEKQEDTSNQEQDHKQMIKKIIVVSAAGGVILIIVVALIIIKIKKSSGSENGYIPYENVLDSYEEDEIEEKNNINQEDEFYEEEPKKKKRSKGKRFK